MILISKKNSPLTALLSTHLSFSGSLAQVVTVSSSEVSVAVSWKTVSITCITAVMGLSICFSGSLGQGSDEMGEKVGSTDFGEASDSRVSVFVAGRFSRSLSTATKTSGSEIRSSG